MNKPLQNIILRGNDPTGHGYYGAKRGNAKHQGLDIVSEPGECVFSMITGKVTKIGYAYSYAPHFRYIEVLNDTYRAWLMYVEPLPVIVVGQKVNAGETLGEAQNIADYWDSRNPETKKMLNHVHVQIWKNGLLTDPEPILMLL